jgi:hypothetical protein
MSINKEKIEKGRIKSLFTPRKAGVHKWMKNQMNRFTQKWRRGKKIAPIPPYLLGQAIDKAIQTLRKL